MKKFVSLLSSGLDSPVAVYLMMNQGFKPILLSFLTSDDSQGSMRNHILQSVEILSKLAKTTVKIYLINHDPNLSSFTINCERKLTCILCKRLMIRIAKHIGKLEGTNLIVTGDILGEQASQTLDNLFSYNNLLENYTILRPLIGRDKLEVMNINKKIGLYELASDGSAGCQFNPQYPETHAKLDQIHKAEEFLDIKTLINDSIKNAEILEI